MAGTGSRELLRTAKDSYLIVAICTAEIRIPGSRSLKEKRMLVRRIKDRLGRKYNISIAEVDRMEIHNQALLGIAAVSNDRRHLESVMQKVERDTSE